MDLKHFHLQRRLFFSWNNTTKNGWKHVIKRVNKTYSKTQMIYKDKMASMFDISTEQERTCLEAFPFSVNNSSWYYSCLGSAWKDIDTFHHFYVFFVWMLDVALYPIKSIEDQSDYRSVFKNICMFIFTVILKVTCEDARFCNGYILICFLQKVTFSLY